MIKKIVNQTFPVVVVAQAQVAHAAADAKDELGMYAVKCQVVENAPGNPIVGFMMGNHPKSLDGAEDGAHLYESKFDNAHKSIVILRVSTVLRVLMT